MLPGDDEGYSVQQTADGGYIIAGTTESFGAGRGDVWLIKTDASGDSLWTKVIGGSRDEVGWSVQQTSDGGYVVAGYTESFGTGDADVWLIKTDASGDTLWTKTHGGPAGEEGKSVQQTSDGGYVITGYTHSFSAEGADVYLIKTNAQGDTLWTRTFDGGGDYWGGSVQQTADGGYILTGITGGGGQDVYLVKTNAQGDSLWTRRFGGSANDGGYSVVQASDGGYLISGFAASFGSGRYDVYLVKTDADLNASPAAILSPSGTAESARVYTPSAVVRNVGLTAAAFPVTMIVGAGYTATVQETLASGLSDTIVFPSWTAEPVGQLAVTCFTSLAGDMDPTNDTIRDSIQVVPPPRHDVSAVDILAPSGTLRAGDTVTPRARIRNFGNRVERFFDVRFRIGTNYNQKVNVADALPAGSTAELTFPPWVAETGDWAVSCSTMLGSDVDRTNDKATSTVRVFAQTLQIEPDRSERLEAGKNKTYQFYALVQGDTGGVVEVARPAAPAGWSARLADMTGTNDLTDTDGDGIPDLGYVVPGETSRFSLEVQTPSGLAGDTASLTQKIFVLAGHMGNDSTVADTALLNLNLVPGFSIHNWSAPGSMDTAERRV